jgi:pentose-5-phosphate-3-epimerase
VSGAAVLLAEIRATGVDVGLADGVLRVRAPKGMLTVVQRERLVEHHAEIITLLAEPANDGETLADDLPPDLQAVFDERAAIVEVDGGLNRDAAERLARQEVTSAGRRRCDGLEVMDAQPVAGVAGARPVDPRSGTGRVG